MCAGASAAPIKIDHGQYKPIYGKGKDRKVSAFFIDETAVTNRGFKEFIEKNPKWATGAVPTLFADNKYLKHWASPASVGDGSLDEAPVVNVSWFAAKAFCDSRDMRLPTTDEWEYLAQFGPADSKVNAESIILEWYSKPTPAKTAQVKSTFKNKFGVWDVHGLIWEWTYDFNTTFVTGESRGDAALEKSMFCGSGAAEAADPSKYAAFMRFGFRSSLKGNYTVENLGFRCAKDALK